MGVGGKSMIRDRERPTDIARVIDGVLQTSGGGGGAPVGTQDINIIEVSGVPVGGSVPIDDNGGSLTVDDGGGSLTVDHGGVALDINIIEVSGGAVGGSVPINDGGNLITVNSPTFDNFFATVDLAFDGLAVTTLNPLPVTLVTNKQSLSLGSGAPVVLGVAFLNIHVVPANEVHAITLTAINLGIVDDHVEIDWGGGVLEGNNFSPARETVPVVAGQPIDGVVTIRARKALAGSTVSIQGYFEDIPQ